MADISQTELSDTFSWTKILYFFVIKISLKFVAKGASDNKRVLV